MAITRTNAASYLNADFSSLANKIQQSASDDSASGYGPDIDNALRALGKAELDLASATVEESDRAKYFAALSYYAARRFRNQLSFYLNTSLGPYAESGTAQAREMLDSMVKEYGEQMQSLGIYTEGQSVNSVVWNTDWVEDVLE